jgi:hypothetical protein
MVDFIVCDADKMEKGYLTSSAELDFDIGGEYNDCEVTVPLGTITWNDWIICPGTEYGALMEELSAATDDEDETWTGNSLREFLNEAIICPDAGQDYKIVSGDAHDIMRALVASLFDGLFEVPDVASGFTIKSYQFNRYVTVLDGVSAMLKTVGARIKIEIIEGAEDAPFSVQLTAVPITDYSGELEWSEDAHQTLTESRRGINHLICLGQGELKNRQVVHLYGWPDGSVSEKQYYTGLAERTKTYDYPSAENVDQLKSDGIKKLQELMNSKSMAVSVEDMELEIGDIVGGKSYVHDISMTAPITEKIVNIKDGEISISYKTEGE